MIHITNYMSSPEVQHYLNRCKAGGDIDEPLEKIKTEISFTYLPPEKLYLS